MTYKNLTYIGTLTEILYRETRDPSEALVKLTPQSTTPIMLTRIMIVGENRCALSTEFLGNVPEEYVGRQVALVESLTRGGRIKKHSQLLCAQGLPTLEGSLSWFL